MALSNEDRQEIEQMIKDNQPQVDEEAIKKSIQKLIPEIFGKSLQQLRAFFISNIT